MEEKLGAFLLSLILLSFAISLIPMSYVSYGSPYGRTSRFDDRGEIAVHLEVGSVELLEANGSGPYAVVRGIQLPDSGGELIALVGRLSIYVPEGWEGSVRVRMRHGNVTLSGVRLKDIYVSMGSGSVKGDLTVLRRASVELGAGSVYLTLNVPSGSEPRVMLRCKHYSLRYDGKALSGSSLESVLWEGSHPLSIEVRASSAELSVIRVEG